MKEEKERDLKKGKKEGTKWKDREETLKRKENKEVKTRTRE